MSESEKNKSTFKIAVRGLSSKFDSHVFDTANDYIILEHLLMPLIHYGPRGHLEGVAASKWEINENYTEFKFQLKNNLYFSDGSSITAKSVKESWSRTKFIDKSLHYNFENIKEIKTSGEREIIISLKETDYFFIFKLQHPEFGILHSSDATRSIGEQTFLITSGAYSLNPQKGESDLLSSKMTQINLKKNSYWQNNSLKKDILVFVDVGTKASSSLFSQKYDLIWGEYQDQAIKNEDLNKWGYTQKIPRLNFSYWISINPNLIETKSIKFRQCLQKIFLDKNFLTPSPFISSSRQLYFDNGPGRLDGSELEVIEKNINQIPIEKICLPNDKPTLKLKALFSQYFIYKEIIINELKKQNIELEMTTYENFKEYREIISKDDFHLVQVNNDFCSPDVSTSIAVSFNNDRPLIFTNPKEHNFILENVHSLSKTHSLQERAGKAHFIGEKLLTEGLIIPLFYFHSVLYHKNEYDLSNWSQAFTDLSLWKITQQKN